MSDERWARLPSDERYEISDQGRVRSLVRRKPRILKSFPVRLGSAYLRVNIGFGGGRFVHGLVAEAFIGPRPAGQEVRHLDGDPSNNTLSNLLYGTPAENAADRVRHGRDANARRTHCKHGHEYTPENTALRGNVRQCIACRRRRLQDWRAKQRAQRTAVAA